MNEWNHCPKGLIDPLVRFARFTCPVVPLSRYLVTWFPGYLDNAQNVSRETI